ncbi:MAG: hypothetical protein SOY64_08875, partial [Pyramidobacter sp.]|nr:hypothetical protein [Pyramidobacter sp.]
MLYQQTGSGLVQHRIDTLDSVPELGRRCRIGYAAPGTSAHVTQRKFPKASPTSGDRISAIVKNGSPHRRRAVF